MDPKTKRRTDQLYKLGLRYDGSSYILHDINVHWTEITCDADNEWNKNIEKIRTEMKRMWELKIKEERKKNRENNES